MVPFVPLLEKVALVSCRAGARIRRMIEIEKLTARDIAPGSSPPKEVLRAQISY
jgi:hypothetical protein